MSVRNSDIKKRGSGFLQDIDSLDKFFYAIFEKRKNIKISIKTRIGFCDYDEWDELLKVYKKYDFNEIIIHPRLRSDFYKNNVYLPAFLDAGGRLNTKLIYNGDINTLNDYIKLKENLKNNIADGIMVGRGLVRNPLLAESIKSDNKIFDLSKTIDFVNDIRDEYLSLDFGERNTLFKLKEIWGLILCEEEKYSKVLKKIRKSNAVKDYNNIIAELKNV